MAGPEKVLAQILNSKKKGSGDNHYRAYVGPPDQYDFMGASQFFLLFTLGLRETHTLLDVGCGSLRAGKYFLQYLLPGNYHGVEPNYWLWKDAFKIEIGNCVKKIKNPDFHESIHATKLSRENEFDYVLAQSIFSHSGVDLFSNTLAKVSNLMKPGGRFLFTVLDETTGTYEQLERGDQINGWKYPLCVSYTKKTVEALCENAGLFAQPFDWFHPRQKWYHAVKYPEYRLTDADLSVLSAGKPIGFKN